MNDFLSSIGELLGVGVYAIIAIVIMLLIFIIPIKLVNIVTKNNKKTAIQEKDESETERQEDNKDTTEISTVNEYPYHKKDLLTKNEWAFYKSLKPITDKYNLHILSKVRISDLIEVNNGLSNSERTSANNKINRRHFDFVLADPRNLRIYGVIELDDSSHERIDRQQRDFFIDKICEVSNLPIIHCNDINGVENQICEKLNINKKSP